MNILMIDDMLLPEKTKADSPQKRLFLRFSEENRRRRFFLAKEFKKFGANVLLIRLSLSEGASSVSFEFCDKEEISQLFIKIPKGRQKVFLRSKELLEFCSALLENSPGLSGLFKPDIVISGGVLNFGFSAGEKIAENSGAVFITEASCAFEKILKRFALCSKFSALPFLLKKSAEKAFLKSDSVLGFFPKVPSELSGAQRVFPMFLPPSFSCFEPSEEAKILREKLSAFGEGKNFSLAFCGELEEGYSIEELILSASSFGEKISLCFLFEGAKKPYLKRFCAEKGITNVFFFDDVPKEEISYILSGADAVFVSEFDFSKGLFPEQENFWNALGAQKPVIAASEHWADFFRKAGGAIIVKPRRKDSISLGIKTLLSMAEADRDILGASNRNFYEKNSPENFAKEYFSLFDNLLSQKENKK